VLCSVVLFQKYGFVTCIRVIAILKLIRQLYKLILYVLESNCTNFGRIGKLLRGNNEENVLLAGTFDEYRDNGKTCFRVSGHKLEVFICQIKKKIRNPLTVASYLLIKATQREAINSRLY
jgi:hypothetical protein